MGALLRFWTLAALSWALILSVILCTICLIIQYFSRCRVGVGYERCDGRNLLLLLEQGLLVLGHVLHDLSAKLFLVILVCHSHPRVVSDLFESWPLFMVV